MKSPSIKPARRNAITPSIAWVLCVIALALVCAVSTAASDTSVEARFGGAAEPWLNAR